MFGEKQPSDLLQSCAQPSDWCLIGDQDWLNVTLIVLTGLLNSKPKKKKKYLKVCLKCCDRLTSTLIWVYTAQVDINSIDSVYNL